MLQQYYTNYFFLLFGNVCKNLNFYNFLYEFETSKYDFVSLCYILKEHSLLARVILNDFFVLDFPGKRYRFLVIYNFLCMETNQRFFLSGQVKEGDAIYSVIDLFENAS